MQQDTILISSLEAYPMSHHDMTLGRGYAVLKTNGLDITGVAFGLANSVMSNRELDYIMAIRNCIFGPDNESGIGLDNEGTYLDIDLHLQQDGIVICSVDLSGLDIGKLPPEPSYYLNDDIHNEYVGKKPYLMFNTPVVRWCESVIQMAREISPKYELPDGYFDDIYDASGYVEDIEAFVRRYKNKKESETVSDITSQIKASKQAPKIRPYVWETDSVLSDKRKKNNE